MKTTIAVIVAAALAMPLQIATAQTTKAAPAVKAQLKMDSYPGTTIQTNLGYNIKLNQYSKLNREWFVVRDEASPVSIVEAAGINVSYDSKGSRYEYKMSYAVDAKEPVSAIELKVHVFDVFGRPIKTLVGTEVTEVDGKGYLNMSWRIWTENEASEAFASVAYISTVRTQAGRVYEIDKAGVAEQVKKVFKKITEADLEPKKDEKK